MRIALKRALAKRRPWKEEGNQEAINRVGDLEMDFMERRSVAMADHVVSPSRYLLRWMARQAGGGGGFSPHPKLSQGK